MLRYLLLLFMIVNSGKVNSQSEKTIKTKRTYEVSISEKGDTIYLLTHRQNYSRGGSLIVETFFSGGNESSKTLYFYEKQKLFKSYNYLPGNDSIPYRIDSIIRKEENNIRYTINYYFETTKTYSSGQMHDETIEELDSSGNVILKVNVVDKWEYDKVNCEFFEYDNMNRVTKKVTVYHCEDMRWNFESDKNVNEKSGKIKRNYFEDKRVKNSDIFIEIFYDNKNRLAQKKTKSTDLYFTYSEDEKTIIEKGNRGYDIYYLYNENNDLIEEYQLKPKDTKKCNWKKYDIMYF